MLARLAALAVAAAMVVGAVAVRAGLDDRQEADASELRLVCATEMAGACQALADADDRIRPVVEPAEATAARLLAQDVPDLDGWLVPGPWPTFVAEARQRAGRDRGLVTGEALARSPVVLLVWPDRAAVLAGRCGGEIGWRCLGEVAGARWSDLGGPATWGPVKPGHAPVGSAEGLAVVGAATVGYFGRADLSRADLDTDEYRGWLAGLERNLVSRASSPVEDMLLRGRAGLDAVGTLEALAAPVLASAARTDRPETTYPSPMVSVELVLGTVPGPAGDRLAGLVGGRTGRDIVRALGWTEPDATPAVRPAPGLLDALRQVAAEVAR